MTTENTKAIRYNDHNFQVLMEEYKKLSTFAEVTEWDKQAQAEANLIAQVIQQLNDEITEQIQALEQEKRSRSEKSLFSRILSNRKSEKELDAHIMQCQSFKATLEELAAKLQEAIDFTPNTLEERKALVKELKQRKKELQVEKRSVAAEMKAIRAEAQHQSANAGTSFIGIYNSKLAASQRRSIRYARESTLRPHEDAKSAIERQLLQVDRDILWAERFIE